jgi:uncharacterized membrane protein YfcA
MTPIEWLFLTIIISLAGVIRGCIGFGFSALVIASSTLFLDPTIVVPMMAVLEIIASIHMAITTWRDAERKILIYLLVGATIATPLGVYALVILPADSIRLLLSLMILILSGLLACGWQYRGRRGPGTFFFLGLLSGVCNGAAAVGGLPVATFLTAMKLNMASFRATLVLFFFGIDIVFILSASGHGLYTQSLIIMSVLMIIPMTLGVHLGGKLFTIVPEERLKTGVIGLLILLSLIGLTRAAIGLF